MKKPYKLAQTILQSTVDKNGFNSIDLVYNDMHMGYCNKEQKPALGVMEINYCKEGHCECLFGAYKRAFSYE